MFYYFYCIVLLFGLNTVKATNYTTEHVIFDTKEKLSKENLIKFSLPSATSEFNFNFPYDIIISNVLQKFDNETCAMDVIAVLEGITERKKWALQMFDSFSKFPVGILYGNHYQLGNFDECTGVDQGKFKGQYCLADMYFQFNLNDNKLTPAQSSTSNRNLLHWGICLPSSCTPYHAKTFVETVFKSVVTSSSIVSVLVTENSCYYQQNIHLSKEEIIYGSIVGMFFLLSTLATAFHYWHIVHRKRCIVYSLESVRLQKSGKFKQSFLSFSVIRTIGNLLDIRPTELNLECIYGIKFLSICLVIASNTMIFVVRGPTENVMFFKQASIKLDIASYLVNSLMVDTFLFVSGFLMCRLLLLQLDKRDGKVNVFVLYLARYIRLTPVYLVIIGFYATWFYQAGDGPLWKQKTYIEKEHCIKSWWTNIAYVNNYVKHNELCMFQSWYLAVDFQLCFLSIFVIYLLRWFKRAGQFVLALCTGISITLPFCIIYAQSLESAPNTFLTKLSSISEGLYFHNAFTQTHMRASSYCMGLIFGYLVYRIQNSGIKLRTCIIWIGWIISIPSGIVAIVSIMTFYNPHHASDSIVNTPYGYTIHTICWSLFIGWVALMCITDNAVIINRFLSWKPFVPVSRLSYCAYLVNGLVEIYTSGVQRHPMYLSKYELICKILGHVALTYILAFILHIYFEAPFQGLEKTLLRKEIKQRCNRNRTTNS